MNAEAGVSALPGFDRYLAHLRWLVAEPSSFTEPQLVGLLMGRVKNRMSDFLPNYRCERDGAGNLVCVPREPVMGPLLYLSAHVDTVPTDPAAWTPPFTARPGWEDEEQLVGQGVNDCKAGAATQLWLAEMFGRTGGALRNVIFLLTFKEEGSGPKTGTELGGALGRSIPAPLPGSTLLVLENTVNIQRGLPLLYPAEASSFTIRVEGSLPDLQDLLRRLPLWRPVAILPVAPEPPEVVYSWTEYTPLGHVCTAPPERNPLLAVLREAGAREYIRAGDERSHGTVPALVGRAAGTIETRHRLTLTKRGNFALAETEAELAPLQYEAVKPLAQSAGFDATTRLAESAVGRAFTTAAKAGLVEFERNPGSSDATIITSAMPREFRATLVPLVYGPGSRSQREATPPRLTHGPNETFVKSAGEASLAVLLRVLRESGHLA